MTKKPRIIITLEPKNNKILELLCLQYNQTKSKMINKLIEQESRWNIENDQCEK